MKIKLSLVYSLFAAILVCLGPVPPAWADYVVSISESQNLADDLIVYIEQEDIASMRKMLDEGKVKVDDLSPDGWSALLFAASEGLDEIVEILLRDYDANPDIVQQLNEIFTDFEEGGDNHLTPLMLACINEHPKVVEILLRHCAKIGETSQNGKTARDFAKRQGNDEILYLLDHPPVCK